MTDARRPRSPQSQDLSVRPDKKTRLGSASPARPGTPVKDEPNTKSGGKNSSRKKKQKQKHTLPEPYTAEFVVATDVANLLGQETVDAAVAEGSEWSSPFQHREELELTVSALSSSGDSLSVVPSKPWVIVTPLALPGEKIRVRVYRSARLYSYADLLDVITPNPEFRDMSRVQCKYFGKCAGCQYQMLSYEKQLDLKRDVVVKAYEHFSDLSPSSVPTVPITIGSPLQYGYRTKITPHFDAPPKKLQKSADKPLVTIENKPDWVKIGFNQIGTRQVMDIEDCPIATPTLNEALPPLRKNIIEKIYSYKKGVSLLLRDSLEMDTERNTSKPEEQPSSDQAAASELMSSTNTGHAVEKHVCITDHKATVRERVGDNTFEYIAGSFFQNNNSVLLPLTSYVRDAIFAHHQSGPTAPPRPTHLVDAYCGSGLFAITLARSFQKVAGIELSEDSIRCATRNAQLNDIPPDQCSFMSGDAANIFATVQDFPRDQTVLIIDPPRKGTDEKFIDQLLEFQGALVVYVSCNVHTQARDVGTILRKSEASGGRRYVMESLVGFDLFPQTAHVESVAVLRLV